MQYQNLDLPGLLDSPEVGEVGEVGRGTVPGLMARLEVGVRKKVVG